MVELATALPQVDGLQAKTYNVTTGASPTDFTLPNATVPRIIIKVTSGGTAGTEVLNLIAPAYNGSGSGNEDYINVCVTVILDVQTDPADVVQITRNGEAAGKFYNSIEHMLKVPRYATLTLPFEGSAALFRWNYDDWTVDIAATDDYPSYTFDGQSFEVQGAVGASLWNFGPVTQIRAPGLPTADPGDGVSWWSDPAADGAIKVASGP